LKSNPSDRGGSDDLQRSQPVPPEIADALVGARARLGRLGSPVLYFQSIGSTNDVAARLADRPASEGAIVLADEQTAGRGRRGHTWFSPPAAGLYVSVVLAPVRARVDHERATALLTLSVGVALADAIEAVTGLRIDLKWPNDLFAARRKLGGILAEAAGGGATGGAVVVGYGINVSAASFPPELGDRATSLESELARPVDRTQVLVETLAALSRRYDELLDGRYDAILDAWRARAPGSVGASVAWETMVGRESGVTAGIDGRGALLVRAGDRIERIVAGAIQWL
jgi:BirA family transcriptional regulator, biotin operon repressor / biotin---[acetyl-CoA-carboxylase] ligase